MSTNGAEVKAPKAAPAPSGAHSFARALAVALWLTTLSTSPALAAVAPKLKEALSSSSIKVRIIAIAGVAKSGEPETRGLLEPLLRDPEPTVRGAAVDGLASLQDPGALAVLLPLKSDPDQDVRAIVGRAIATLEALIVNVDVGNVEDLSGGSIPELVPLLQSVVEGELRKALVGYSIRRGGVTKGFGLLLKIRSIKKSVQDGNGIIEVKCDMTLVELPGNILRLSSSATAGAGVEGEIPKSMEKELAQDAVNACGPSLAKDFIEYAQQHRAKK